METREKNLNIIWPHLAFIFAFPCYLSSKYETVDLRKVYISSILIFISMVCLFFAAKKYEVITNLAACIFNNPGRNFPLIPDLRLPGRARWFTRDRGSNERYARWFATVYNKKIRQKEEKHSP